MTAREILDTVAEQNPDALAADGLEVAIVGWTLNHHSPVRVVYDYDKCVGVLVERDGMTHEEADEFLSYNTLGAYVGPNGPVYVRLA